MNPLVLGFLTLAVPTSPQSVAAAAAPRVVYTPELARPAEVRAMPCGTHVDLRWQDRSSAEVAFVVRRRVVGARLFDEIGLVPANHARFRDAGVVLGTHYEYRVAARRDDGLESPLSRACFVTPNANPPVITSSLAQGTHLRRGEERAFTMHVSDPDGDRVSLRLLNPPPGLVFLASEFEPGPLVRELVWRLPIFPLGHERLVFQAGCELGPRFALDLVVDGQVGLGTLPSTFPVTGDVTGDGIDDVVIAASSADQGGLVDVGQVYVWHGRATPAGAPDAVLEVSSPSAGLALGRSFAGQSVRLVDLSGDGVLDVFVTAPRALYLWNGGPGLAGTVSESAVLVPPWEGADDVLGNWHGAGGELVQVADVTGDGTLDVVALSVTADLDTQRDVGVAFLWVDTAFAGSVPVSGVLSVFGAEPEDELGGLPFQGLKLGDVSGDGILDLVIGAPDAGARDTGEIHVYQGGGIITPLWTLAVPGAVDPDKLGEQSGNLAETVQLADVTGDGVLDIVALGNRSRRDGRTNVSAVHVWAGGAPPFTTRGPTVSFTDDDTHVGAELGLLLADLDLDGVLDVLSAGYQGTLDEWVLEFWRGGARTGAVAPDAVLMVPGGHLGFGALRLADVDDDGRDELVHAARYASDGERAQVGKVFVWDTNALGGAPPPRATLAVPLATEQDQLGLGLEIADVSGDGVRDVIAGSPFADTRAPNTGALYVWRGGSALVGACAPSATLTVPRARANDRLGTATHEQEPLRYWLGDVCGDGALDLVVVASFAKGTDEGALYVWQGGATLQGARAPQAFLEVAGLGDSARLGLCGSQGVALLDLDDDGRLDVLVGATLADEDGVLDSGALYAWRGGDGLAGQPPPSARLRVPGASPGDTLGGLIGAFGHVTSSGFRLADITGDGRPEVLALAPYADPGGVVDAGAVHVWSPAAGLAGVLTPLASFTVPGATPGDRLGWSGP